jgi:hypothetical protein
MTRLADRVCEEPRVGQSGEPGIIDNLAAIALRAIMQSETIDVLLTIQRA